jgi:hypothetical protein
MINMHGLMLLYRLSKMLLLKLTLRLVRRCFKKHARTFLHFNNNYKMVARVKYQLNVLVVYAQTMESVKDLVKIHRAHSTLIVMSAWLA